MKRSAKSRRRVDLSAATRRRLNMYALAATAAGVSALATAQPADARIVYTPTNVKIGENHAYKLDLNHDGITDFIIQNNRRSRHQCVSHSAVTDGLSVHSNSNGFGIEARSATSQIFALALTKGTKIGVGKGFGVGFAEMARWTYGNFRTRFLGCKSINAYSGSWVNVEQKYLGFKFEINGKTHYGWARLNVELALKKGIVVKLAGYAYETVPDKPIIAGKTKGPNVITLQPGTLGRLAVGRR
jgi:hypothetical protein